MIRRQLVIPVGAEQLWDALTDPDQVESWFGARVEWELRDGAPARFWGDDRNGARRYANGADRSLARRMKAKADRERFFPWDDGYPFTSPVESFQPNGFGLHDMLGNGNRRAITTAALD